LDYRELCLALAYAEGEEVAIEVLREAGFWDKHDDWVFYGGKENNWSTINNQQANSDGALVEKLVNSIDAMLMLRCYQNGLNPQDITRAPSSIGEAVETFFGVRGGAIETLDRYDRVKLADNIMIVAYGSKQSPCFHITDRGEGQTPARFPNTLVSLDEGNKTRIQFVQGRFNMGGTGALSFCGTHKLQLIISRRHPDIAKNETDDDTAHQWGFTIVRKFPAVPPMKNPVFKYLAPKGEVLRFDSESLPLIPEKHPRAFGQPLESGTFIKLYDYQLQGRLKSNIRLNLFFRLSLLLPRLALPVRMIERRAYDTDRFETTLAGLEVRLARDTHRRVVKGFPKTVVTSIRGSKLKYSIFVFTRTKTKSGKKRSRARNLEAYVGREGVCFIIDGQMQGWIDRARFKSEKINLGYISDSLLVLVDCSEIDPDFRSEMFMGSRDRIKRNEFTQEVENTILTELKNHPDLKRLNNERRKEEATEKSDDSRFRHILEDLNKRQNIVYLFNPGMKLKTPFNLTDVGEKEVWTGKKWPDLFKLADHPQKIAHKGSHFEMKYVTDASNDYFSRGELPGQFSLFCKGNEISGYYIPLIDGTGILRVRLPDDVESGDILHYKSVVSDYFHRDGKEFIDEFEVTVKKPMEPKSGTKGKRKPRSDYPGDDQKGQQTLADLDIYEVRRNKWNLHDFNEFSAMRVVPVEDGKYDYYVNMDNHWLHDDIKQRGPSSEPEELKFKFKYGLALVALAILCKDPRTGVSNDPEELAIELTELVEKVTRAYAPVVLLAVQDL
jgi:hypothetical protein